MSGRAGDPDWGWREETRVFNLNSDLLPFRRENVRVPVTRRGAKDEIGGCAPALANPPSGLKR
jgi:hypothetical protein